MWYMSSCRIIKYITYYFFSGTIEEITTCENQAIGRACRIGQKNQVRVIKLITSNI